MGREVRKVRPDWRHPSDGFYHGGEVRYLGKLSGSYEKAAAEYAEEAAKWEQGLESDYNGGWKPKNSAYATESYADYAGEPPQYDDYMPNWTPEEATHFMMYETCSEGSPISPAFATPEELARWLADTGASSFGDYTSTYDEWLRMITGDGWAVSAVITDGVIQSGVSFSK